MGNIGESRRQSTYVNSCVYAVAIKESRIVAANITIIFGVCLVEREVMPLIDGFCSCDSIGASLEPIKIQLEDQRRQCAMRGSIKSKILEVFIIRSSQQER